MIKIGHAAVGQKLVVDGVWYVTTRYVPAGEPSPELLVGRPTASKSIADPHSRSRYVMQKVGKVGPDQLYYRSTGTPEYLGWVRDGLPK